jgi:hypothetical protein
LYGWHNIYGELQLGAIANVVHEAAWFFAGIFI